MKEKDLLEKIIKGEKIIVLLLCAILLVLIIGVSKMYSNTKVDTSNGTQNETTEYNTDYDVSMFEEIEAKDLKKKTKGELRVVYIGRESCGWCAAFLPNLWQAQEDYGFKTLYIDIAKIIDFASENYDILDQDAFDTLSALSGEGFENYMEQNFGATPMILIMKDNKIIKAQTGYGEYEAFETLLTDAGIKK